MLSEASKTSGQSSNWPLNSFVFIPISLFLSSLVYIIVINAFFPEVEFDSLKPIKNSLRIFSLISARTKISI